MGQQVVGEQDRLSGLQVGLARHDRVRVGIGLCDQCRNQLQRSVGHPAHRVAQPHPEQCRHLVIA